ncbi:Protein of unknown function [Pyronema omphalodes CBS 100304]|uniref:Uncharacterized protein n=1 Tax=Pyronema omphalodes (strain CBS 100304) TaxID=1076935 RepID=U4L6H1_PYROM|nr:Protein of unknown function [Pyronema omphalodes CBS 100304]
MSLLLSPGLTPPPISPKSWHFLQLGYKAIDRTTSLCVKHAILCHLQLSHWIEDQSALGRQSSAKPNISPFELGSNSVHTPGRCTEVSLSFPLNLRAFESFLPRLNRAHRVHQILSSLRLP